MFKYFLAGKSDDVLRLIRDGKRMKIWPENWKPATECKDLHTFLTNRLKALCKKDRVNKRAESLDNACII